MRGKLWTCLLMQLTISMSYAQDSPWLMGDWGGQRTALSQKGIDFEFVLTMEGVYNTTGGHTTGYRNLSNIDLIMDANGIAMGLTEDSHFHLHFLGNYGADPTDYLTLQQDVQFIKNPGLDSALDDALVWA
ncbi:MAG: carbohydrate porin [Phycisphaerae bacterium]|nr:carbohydrate porin [Phycisphaerae bacterium]